MSDYEPTKVQQGEKLVQPTPLTLITTSHNPRWPARNLQEHLAQEGYADYVETPLALIHLLALSDDPAKRAEFVRLLETYEGGARQVVELAASRRKHQLQPISLRRFRVLNREKSDAAGSNVYEHRYGLIAGERRLLACAYNHAKHGDPAVIGATAVEMTVEQAEDLAFDENMQRQDMTPLEVGEWIRNKYEVNRQRAKETAGDSRPKYDLKIFAAERGLDYQYARSRYDLTFLPEPLKQKVNHRDLGITEGAKIGREIKLGKRDRDGKPKEELQAELAGYKNQRQRSRTLKELQEHFDSVRENESEDYLRALAYAMQQTLRQADSASKKRIKEAELKAAQRALNAA